MSVMTTHATIPLTLVCPEPMRAAVNYVLSGEYESGFDGHGLDILDIGANVGSFAVWANMRWPSSRITSYEPNPGTFALLKQNTAALANVTCVNAALFPNARPKEPYFARFAGDGEGGLTAYAGETFEAHAMTSSVDVDVVDPKHVRSADIVKIDIEGGEAAVLEALDLSKTSLVLAEFQTGKNRKTMQQVLARDFEAVLDEECPWDPILDYMDYSRELVGDIYGRMFYLRRGQTKLTRSVRT
jgi:FkbM family methyltransferase